MFQRLLAILFAIGLSLAGLWLCFFAILPFAEAPAETPHLPENNETETPLPEKSVTMTIVGDIMLAREVERSIMTNGVDHPFALIKDQWTESDLVIGNFESTIRDAYRYEGEVLAFDVAPEYVTGLKNAGFTHLSLANNHGDDFGADVTEYTRNVIAKLGIAPFGDPVESELHIARTTVNGITFSLIGFHAFIESPTSIVETIRKEAAQGNFVLVMPHWGNEYETSPSIAQTTAAQMFVDAGADLIVGAHPHVIQPIQNLNRIPVAYSLGNFIFDQDWSTGTMQGLMLQITVTKSAVTITPVPLDIKNRQASVMTGVTADEIRDFVGAKNGTMTFPRATSQTRVTQP